MKTKFYLASLALAAVAVGCQNEEFIEEPIKSAEGLIELSGDFAIASVNNETDTRTHWAPVNGALVNAFLPTWSVDAPAETAIAGQVTSDEIGLCWTGISTDGTGAAGNEVLTNYQFFHYGWLGKDQTEVDFGKCPGDGLQNGWTYDEVNAKSGLTGKLNKEVVANGPQAEVIADNKTIGTTTLEFADVNLNSGIYKTDNKAIFGGEYIAYYPYNPNFKNKGCIPAVSKVVYEGVKVNEAGLTDPMLAESTFRYSDVATVNVGAEASKFGFNNLSGLVRLRVFNKTAAIDASEVMIDKVVFYSASSAFKHEVTLSAAAIKAGSKGAALYAETVSSSKSITVNVAENFKVVKKTNQVKGNYITIAALPTTMTDMKVLLHNGAAGKEGWAEYAIGAFEVKAGQPTFLEQEVNAKDFKPVFYATDQATLEAALEQAKTAASAQKPATVKVLGDIVLTNNVTVAANVIVEGDKLIVPEGKVLTLSTGATVKSDIDVLGQTCCGSADAAGELKVEGATLAGAVKAFNGYQGKKAAVINFVDCADAKSILTGTLVLESETELTVNKKADLDAMGATITNNGTFTVLGKFAMLAADGKTVATAGEKYTNNGTFIDKVGANVGGATQYMVNNGDYICEVLDQEKLQEAYIQKTAANIIDLVSEIAYNLDCVQQHNGKDVDIWVSAGTQDNAHKVVIESTKAVTIGNLTIKAGKRLHINPTKALTDDNNNVIGYATLTVNGDINAYGNFNTETDVIKMSAKNLNIFKGAYAYFDNRSNSNLETLMVESTITVVGGTCHIADPKGNTNHALVTCRVLDGAKGTFVGGQPKVIK